MHVKNSLDMETAAASSGSTRRRPVASCSKKQATGNRKELTLKERVDLISSGPMLQEEAMKLLKSLVIHNLKHLMVG